MSDELKYRELQCPWVRQHPDGHACCKLPAGHVENHVPVESADEYKWLDQWRLREISHIAMANYLLHKTAVKYAELHNDLFTPDDVMSRVERALHQAAEAYTLSCPVTKGFNYPL